GRGEETGPAGTRFVSSRRAATARELGVGGGEVARGGVGPGSSAAGGRPAPAGPATSTAARRTAPPARRLFGSAFTPSKVTSSAGLSCRRRSERVTLQPGERGVGDLAPATVDRQRVAAVGKLAVVGDGRRVPVEAKRLPADGAGDGAVPAAGRDQQRPPDAVSGVDLRGRAGGEIGGGSLEQRPAGGRDRPALVQLVRLRRRDRVPEAVAELSAGQGDGTAAVR